MNFINGLLLLSTTAHALLSPEAMTACTLDADRFARIQRRQQSTYADERWINTCRWLRRLGFADPGRLLLGAPNLPGRVSHGDPLNELKRIGFKNPAAMILKFPPILGLRIEVSVASKLRAFSDLGVRNPRRMIENNPRVLGYGVESNVRPKIERLAELGFRNPAKLIESYPRVLGLGLDTAILPKINSLSRFGFGRLMTIRMIESFPRLLGYSIERNIAPKLATLRYLGFRDPVRVAGAYPMLLGLNLEQNLIPKIDALRDRGFPDPVELFEEVPSLAGLNLEHNLLPTLDHLVNAWGYSRDDVMKHPMALANSLSRLFELHAFLAERDIVVPELPWSLRRRLVHQVHARDLEHNLLARGYSDSRAQVTALQDPAAWSMLLRKIPCGENNLASPRSSPQRFQ